MRLFNSAEKSEDVKPFETLAVLRARDIEPLHNVTDPEKLVALKNSMKKDGWVGDPVVVLDGKKPKGVSGSHRIAAATELGMEIPVLVIGPRSRLKMWEAKDDDAVLKRLAELNLYVAVALMKNDYPLMTANSQISRRTHFSMKRLMNLLIETQTEIKVLCKEIIRYSNIQELCLCKSRILLLRPDVTYRFVADYDCAGCREIMLRIADEGEENK